MSETFQFFERLMQVRENPADPNHDTVLGNAADLVRILLHGPYLRSLELEEPFRDEYLPEWLLIQQHLEKYDPAVSDPQPLEHRDPILDYDPERDEFFFLLYDAGDPDKPRARKRPTMQKILHSWNLFRVGDTTSPEKYYSPGAYAVLEALTSMDPSTPPWIIFTNWVWYVRGIPTNLQLTQVVDNSGGGLWEEMALDSAWGQYRNPEERDTADIHLLARHWRSLYRKEDQPLFARDLRRDVYQKWEQEFKDQKVIYTMAGGTRITLGMLERLIKAEIVARTKATIERATEFIMAGPPDSLQAEIDRLSPASGGTTAREFAEFVSPFTEEDIRPHEVTGTTSISEIINPPASGGVTGDGVIRFRNLEWDKKTHTPGKSVEEEEQL